MDFNFILLCLKSMSHKYQKLATDPVDGLLTNLIEEFLELPLTPKQGIIHWIVERFPDSAATKTLLSHLHLPELMLMEKFVFRNKDIAATFYFRLYNKRTGQSYCRHVSLTKRSTS